MSGYIGIVRVIVGGTMMLTEAEMVMENIRPWRVFTH